MVTVTYAFGNYTGVIIVKDWPAALKCIEAWSHLDGMSWLRVQYSFVI